MCSLRQYDESIKSLRQYDESIKLFSLLNNLRICKLQKIDDNLFRHTFLHLVIQIFMKELPIVCVSLWRKENYFKYYNLIVKIFLLSMVSNLS